MKAITHLQEALQDIAELKAQRAALNEKISKARHVTDEAEQLAGQASSLKSRRRGLLARMFLGESLSDGEKSEAEALDSEISTAEQAQAEITRNAEGAQAAIEILSRQLVEIQAEITAAEKAVADLRYKALAENAEAKRREFINAAKRLPEYYAAFVGAARAVNMEVSLSDGRMFYFNPLSLSNEFMVEVAGEVIRADVSSEIMAAQQEAVRALPAG